MFPANACGSCYCGEVSSCKVCLDMSVLPNAYTEALFSDTVPSLKLTGNPKTVHIDISPSQLDTRHWGNLVEPSPVHYERVEERVSVGIVVDVADLVENMNITCCKEYR